MATNNTCLPGNVWQRITFSTLLHKFPLTFMDIVATTADAGTPWSDLDEYELYHCSCGRVWLRSGGYCSADFVAHPAHNKHRFAEEYSSIDQECADQSELRQFSVSDEVASYNERYPLSIYR